MSDAFSESLQNTFSNVCSYLFTSDKLSLAACLFPAPIKKGIICVNAD